MTESDVRKIAEEAQRKADVVAARLDSHLGQCVERGDATNRALDRLWTRIEAMGEDIVTWRRWALGTFVVMLVGILGLLVRIFA